MLKQWHQVLRGKALSGRCTKGHSRDSDAAAADALVAFRLFVYQTQPGMRCRHCNLDRRCLFTVTVQSISLAVLSHTYTCIPPIIGRVISASDDWNICDLFVWVMSKKQHSRCCLSDNWCATQLPNFLKCSLSTRDEWDLCFFGSWSVST